MRKRKEYKTMNLFIIPTMILTVQLCTFASVPSQAKSPVIDTGQSKCYNNYKEITCPQPGDPFYGQDAQYDGIQMSYQDNGDGTVTDLNTSLMWQKTPPTEHYTWDEAATYAENLQLAGYDDWRMPTIKELYSLVAFYGSIRTLTPYINTDYFDFKYPDTSQGYRIIDAQYWSRNKYVGITMRGDKSAFGFNFADGRIKAYPTGKGGGPTKTNYIRCVRGRNGYGQNKYVDNGDGTITDIATGLMWRKADSGTTMNWKEALSYAENLKYAGYDDWRLPNAKELQSIVDYTRAPDALDPAYQSAAIDPIFDLTQTESWFWTSTTHGDNLFGIYVCFGRALSAWEWNGEPMNAHGAGAQRSDPKSGDPAKYPEGLGPQGDEIRIYNYVRCVRNVSRKPQSSDNFTGLHTTASDWKQYHGPKGLRISEDKKAPLTTTAQCNIENPVFELKSEARNPKSETISNVQNTNFQNKIGHPAVTDVWHFGNLNFEFVSNFDIRISNLTRLT